MDAAKKEIETRATILFVDDDANVISGLRRMMRDKRKEWIVLFASSGDEALNFMDEFPVEILVTDLKMPGMDGISLLKQVRDKYPDVLRMILSGHTDTDNMQVTSLPAHQYLAKPIKAESLKSILSNALRMRTMLKNKPLRKLVSNVDSLPSLPKIYNELSAELKKEVPSFTIISKILESDVSMSARLLKMVNSPYYGFQKRVNSVEQAVTLLGINAVQSLMLAQHIFTAYDMSGIKEYSLEGLWEHSMRVSKLAAAIAKSEGQPKEFIEECSMAGLLHDVGKLVLICKAKSEYSSILNRVRTEHRAVADIEFEEFETTHAEVGGYLMGLWGMPREVVLGVCFHHSPQRLKLGFSTLAVLHAANALDHQYYVVHNTQVQKRYDSNFFAEAGLTDRFKKWCILAENFYEELKLSSEGAKEKHV